MIAAYYTTGPFEGELEYYMNTYVELDECLTTCLDENGSKIADLQEGVDFIDKNHTGEFETFDFCHLDDPPPLNPGESSCHSSENSDDWENNDGHYGFQNRELRLKLIKDGSTQTTTSKTWHLMFKNVYSLGGTNIDLQSLNVEIIYTAGQSGTETLSIEGNSFLNIFGLDSRNESGILVEGGDGKIDMNYSFINPEYGELIFPFHMPFAYDPVNFNFAYDNGGRDDRFWGNPHRDLQNIFQKDLEELQYDESNYYENYTDGPSMYYNNTNANNNDITNEHKFSILIEY